MNPSFDATSDPTPAPPPHMSRVAWALLLGYTASVFLFALGSARTLTGHEGHFAAIVREMLLTGDWLVPRIGGEPWLEKPLLPHWCMAVAVSLGGGLDEFVIRLPAVLAGLLGVCLVASLATRWFGATTGLLAGLIQATTLYTVTYARLAESDIFLWVLVLACLWLFGRLQVEPRTPAAWWSGRLAFFVMLGATNLAKGMLFGSVLVLIPCMGFFALGRKWRELRWFLYVPGLIMALLIAVAWPIAIAASYPEALSLWFQHLIGRFQGEARMNPKPIWYYVTTFAWQVLPWTPIALIGMGPSARRAWREPTGPDRFLWLWFVMQFVVLSLATGKHHHYLIHALPPFSFWAAGGLLRIRDWAATLAGRRSPAVALVLSVFVIAAGVTLGVHRFLPEFVLDAAALGIMLVLGVSFFSLCWFHGRMRFATASVFMFLWLVLAYVHGTILPRTDSYAEETRFLRRMSALAEEGRPILVYQLEPSRILLYCSGDVERFTSLEELRQRHEQRPGSVIIASRKHVSELKRAGQLRQIDEAYAPSASRGAAEMAAYEVRWHAGSVVRK